MQVLYGDSGAQHAILAGAEAPQPDTPILHANCVVFNVRGRRALGPVEGHTEAASGRSERAISFDAWSRALLRCQRGASAGERPLRHSHLSPARLLPLSNGGLWRFCYGALEYCFQRLLMTSNCSHFGLE